MTTDGARDASLAYSHAAAGWASATSRVYQPLADALVAQAPHDLGGRLVLDVGAGTGCGGTALEAAGARVVSTDLSEGMLRHERRSRPPAAVCDICRLALADDSVDDAIVPFVLNHLPDPALALAELGRVVRPQGAVLASVFSNAGESAARDRVDEVAVSFGFERPAWYDAIVETYAAAVGTAEALSEVGRRAGLHVHAVVEKLVETGMTDPDDLVRYRLSMASYVDWVAGLPADRRRALYDEATAAAAPVMTPYTPQALFLVATA